MNQISRCTIRYELKIVGTVVPLPDAWPYRVCIKTGWSGVSGLVHLTG